MDHQFSKVFKWFCSATIFIASLTTVQAQDSDYKNNSVYLSYGNLIFSDQVSIAYERTIHQKDNYRARIKGSYGKFLSNNLDYSTNAKVYESYQGLSLVQLLGILEFNLGAAYTQYTLARGFSPDPDVDYDALQNTFLVYGNFGVRMEKKNVLIRAGFGNLEYLYLGLGVNF